MQSYQKKLPYILCLVVAFVAGVKQLREPDIWWQLLAGKWMLQHKAITHADMFSYTMTGKPWINVKWLYEVFIAFIEKGLGPEGIMLLQATVNVVIVYFLIRTLKIVCDKAGKGFSLFYAVVSTILFLAVVEYRMAGRPEMVSHLMSAVYLFLLFRYADAGWKNIWWFIPLQCLWANMHEGYPVGMVMIGVYAGGSFIAWMIRKDRTYLQQAGRMAIIFAAAALAILINPNNLQLWKQPFEIYRQVWANKYTTELLSIADPGYWTIQAKIHVPLLALVLIYWLARIVKERNNRQSFVFAPFMITYLLLIPLFGYLSLTANRNIPFAQIVLFPSVPFMLKWLLDLLRIGSSKMYVQLAKKQLWISIALLASCYLFIVSDQYYKATKSENRFGFHINMLHNPVGAAEFIDQYHLKGPAFSDYFVSSYLLWRLYPDFKSYIDLRDLDVFSSSFFDEYFSLYGNPDKFWELVKKYQFNYIVISTSQLQGVLQQLYWREGYNMIYADPVSVIFLRDVEKNNELNHDIEIQKLFSWPLAPDAPAWAVMLNNLLRPGIKYTEEDEINMPVRSAMFYNSVGNYSLAVKQLAPFIYQYDDDATAYVTLANSYMEYGTRMSTGDLQRIRLDSAAFYLQKAREIDPDEKTIYSISGNLQMIFGNFVQARLDLRKFISFDKTNGQVYFLLGLCARNIWLKGGTAGDRDEMIDAMERATAINQDFAKPYLYAADGYLAKGDKDKARERLKKAIKLDGRWDENEKKILETLKAQTGIQ